MAGQRQPIQLVEAKGKKHLTKAEKERRKNSEIQPVNDDVQPPEYLSDGQKREFYEISEQLKKLGIVNETDSEAIARYLNAKSLYISSTENLVGINPLIDIETYNKLSLIQNRSFNQVRAAANDLGLSITSRCKLCFPKGVEDDKPKNKFSKFEAG